MTRELIRINLSKDKAFTFFMRIGCEAEISSVQGAEKLVDKIISYTYIGEAH